MKGNEISDSTTLETIAESANEDISRAVSTSTDIT